MSKDPRPVYEDDASVLVSLAALVFSEAVQAEAESRKYGELQWDMNTDARRALCRKLEAHGFLPDPPGRIK